MPICGEKCGPSIAGGVDRSAMSAAAAQASSSPPPRPSSWGDPNSRAAIKERRYRQRLARGVAVIQHLVLSREAVDSLVALHWLREEHGGDRERVTDALVKFCRFALLGEQR